ncbi:Small subunit processome component 20 -like protein [Babesia sp. Xinjiang]|uniref:Small subunit processome component 20 -like protein n=1 Tax=Babesia sp. Xinjiang TaxID=462227 RepID=UPI000A250188|nr:Small subunit processome component 20 -like protein [Babesia sp. Xinjiang]ORM39793.1 Small subunit processome component 20 -like protein [Babesia sp. Xinjiang]
MTNRGKFKFESASKRSRSLGASTFSDISTVVQTAVPLEERRFFLNNVRNTLRSKDLIRHKQDLKDILNKCIVLKEGQFTSTFSFPEWSGFVIESLLRCAHVSSKRELTPLCRLLALFFKDYGDQDGVNLPFVGLLEILETNPENNAEPIFSFISTHFRINSRCVSDDLGELVLHFTPWLTHKHPLLRRLSMETLSLLLRRVPEMKQRTVLCRLLCMDGSEHLLFGLIKNVNGTVTTKTHSLFKFLLTKLSSSELQAPCDLDVSDARCRISTAMRRCVLMMSRHVKGGKIEMDWLAPLYDDFVSKYNETLSNDAVSAYAIAAELSLEILILFQENYRIKIKDMALIRSGPSFDVFLSHYIVPLLHFAKAVKSAGSALFNEICQLLVRVVRSDSDATGVLRDRFTDILEDLLYFMDDMTSINPLMVLFEWRLKSANLMHVSQVLLVISRVFDNRENFHPVIVNPGVSKRILDCISVCLEDIISLRRELGTQPTYVWRCRLNNAMSIVYGCLAGLSSISSLRCKMNSVPIEIDTDVFDRLLGECLQYLRTIDNSCLIVEVYLLCCKVIGPSDSAVRMESLVEATKMNSRLLSNYRVVEEMSNRFSPSMHSLAQSIVAMLPSAKTKFRSACLKFFAAHFSGIGVNNTSLVTLFDMESLEPSLDNERRKSLLLGKSVESLHLSGDSTPDNELLVCVLFKILLSQYLVKYAPIWQAAYESLEKLTARLATFFTGKKSSTLNSLLDSMLVSCFKLLESSEAGQPMEVETLPSFVVPFIADDNSEPTDAVTLQREVLRAMTIVISHVSNKEPYMMRICSYAHAQMTDESRLRFRKHALGTLATLLQKYKLKETPSNIVDTCLRDGIRSSDGGIRECSLLIVSKRYPGLNMKRLQDLATGDHHAILLDDDSSSTRLKNAEMRELSLGIEIRMLCPRILQHSKQLHGKDVFEYLSNLDPRYLSLLCAELLPGCFGNLFFSPCNMGDVAFSWMVDVLGFNADVCNNFPIQKAIRTVVVMVNRLKKRLNLQALPLFACCMGILSTCIRPIDAELKPGETYLSDCNIDSLISVTITLMVDLLNTFGNMLPQFMAVISDHGTTIETLLNGHKDVLSLIACLTSSADIVEELCMSVIRGAFPGIFQRSPTPQLVGIIENLYCRYAPSLVSGSASCDVMTSFLVAQSSVVLECIKDYKPFATHIVKAILLLPVEDVHRSLCLSILLSNLPDLKIFSFHKLRTELRSHDHLRSLRRLLECLKLCVSLLRAGNVSIINKIWNFVNDCLFYIGDLECRRLSCSVLSCLPVQDKRLVSLCDHLLTMNDSSSGSMDAKLDFDVNCDRLALLVTDVAEKDPSAKVLFTALSHALFVLLCGHKDPTVRRCVLLFTHSVMSVISRSFLDVSVCEPLVHSNVSSACDYMDTGDTPFAALLLNGIFPFIQRCISATNLRETLFFVSIELLEQFSKCFSADSRLSFFFGECLHGDLLCNGDVLDCLSNLHHVQKHVRNEGLKQLCRLISGGVFSSHTICRIFVPICLHFLQESELPRYELFREGARDCLIECGKKLSAFTLLKFLRQLLEVYDNHVQSALQIFSNVVRAFPVSSDGESSSLISKDDGNNESYSWLLQRLRGRLMRSEDGVDIPCIDTYEAVGSLLHHQRADVREKEAIKHSRLLCKSLCSRNREVRRNGRLSLVKFLHCLGFSYFAVILKELSSTMTRGFQLQVLIFTCHSILSSFSNLCPSLKITCDDGLETMLHMITVELLLQHEKDGIASKLDEARNSKAAGLIELLGEFGDLEVCRGICRYLWSILKGTCMMPPDSCFEYSNKLLQVVHHLISSSIIGFIANRNVDLYCLASSLFYGYLPLVRGMSKRLKAQLPPDIYSQYVAITKAAAVSLKLVSSDTGGDPGSAVTSTKYVSNDANKKKEEHYTLFSGTSTGRSLSTSKKMGFDDHIVSPLLVNVALRIYAHMASVPGNVFISSVNNDVDASVGCLINFSVSHVPSITTAFGIVLCFFCDDLKLQRSSASCLFHLCNDNVAFMDMCGPVLAEHLVERLGSMQLVGSEDLAKDHLRLCCQFLRSRSNNILFTAWKKSGKPNELVSGLLLLLEANLDRVGLQSALLKLFTVLLQLEVSNSTVDKTLYEAFQEIFVRMLKGGLTPAAMRASARAIAQFLIRIPMEESNRSKRFGLLLKHVTSPIPLVRLTVLQCLQHLLKGLSKKGGWKRYSEMVVVCIAMQLLHESDLECKRVMATTISFTWSESSVDLKKGLLDCVGHFLGKSAGFKEAAFAYFLFHCLSTEISVSWMRKSRIFDTIVPFTDGLDRPLCVKAGDILWQFPYYWLRLLFHFLTISKGIDILSLDGVASPQEDSMVAVMNKTWRFAVEYGTSSNHPWVRAASLRVLSLVLRCPADYDKVYTSRDGDMYSLAKPCMKLLSTETGMVERHEKVGAALKECLMCIIDNMFRHVCKSDKNVHRFVSKLCYDLRLCLGKSRRCGRRIELLLSLLHHYVANVTAFEKLLRAPMLRVIIASSRALTCNLRLPSTKDHSSASEETSERLLTVSDFAHQIISTIENRFRVLDQSSDYLTLLSFARDFVSRRRMMQRTKKQSNRLVIGKAKNKGRKRRLK